MQYLLRFRVRYLLLHIKASGRLSVASISPVLEVLPFLYPFLPNKNSLPLKPRPSLPSSAALPLFKAPSLPHTHPPNLPPSPPLDLLPLSRLLSGGCPALLPSIHPPASSYLPPSVPPSQSSILSPSVCSSFPGLPQSLHPFLSLPSVPPFLPPSPCPFTFPHPSLPLPATVTLPPSLFPLIPDPLTVCSTLPASLLSFLPPYLTSLPRRLHPANGSHSI